MNGFKTFLFSISFAFATAGVSAAASYYVTESGTGSRNGADVNSTWSVANFNAASPTGGDTVYFSGTITSQIIPKSSGTGTGGGILTLDFTSAQLNISASPEIYLNGKNYLKIVGGTFATGNGNKPLIVCTTSPAHDITVDGWKYTGPSGGTSTFMVVGACTNVTISNNIVDNVACFVNQYQGANSGPINIINNYARTSINTVTQTDIINLGDTSNVTIQGNKLVHRSPGQNNDGTHNDILQTYHGGGSSSQDPSGWVIRYNWLGLEMETPERSGDNSWMMMENMTNGSAGYACKIYGNVFYGGAKYWSGNNGWGCSLSNSSARMYIYNNTMIRKNGPNNGLGGSGGGPLYMRNNAGMAAPGESGNNFNVEPPHYSIGATWDRNFFYQLNGCDSTIAGPKGSCSMNPGFIDFVNDNFALQPSSPLVNAGDSSIGSEYNQGLAPGATWPNPRLVTRAAGSWDVGAYQSSSGGASSPQLTPPTVSLVVH